jgi:hypothetical protein
MSQKQQQLSEFQQTLKELQKIGSFNEEELQYLKDMDKTMSEVSQEIMQDSSTIRFLNKSNNPDPTFAGNKILLQAHLSSEVRLLPNQVTNFSTGINFLLPPNVILGYNTPVEFLKKGIVVTGYYEENDTLYFSLLNYSQNKYTFKGGSDLVEVYFTYCMNDETTQLRKMES